MTTANYYHPLMVALRKAANDLLAVKRRIRATTGDSLNGTLVAAQNAYRRAYDAAEKSGVLTRPLE